jgi:ATP-dependent HslUV protease subunit HslV
MSFKGTTIIAVLRNGVLAVAGDGQVTLGDRIIKSRAVKIRRISQHNILGGFAGHTADAFTLFDRFESRLENASGNIVKAAVELAKDWRMDKALRQLEAMLLVGTPQQLLVISGQGDVLEPDEPLAAIVGSYRGHIRRQGLISTHKPDRTRNSKRGAENCCRGMCLHK